MSPRQTTDEALAAIAALGEADASINLEAELRKYFAHRSNFVVAKAVALAHDRNLSSLAPDIQTSFAKFLEDCVKRDPGCSAKLAIVNCLNAFAEPAQDVFLAGVRHVQLEPAWGGTVDTAPTLRALCGRGLMAIGHCDAFRWHALLIADPEPMTRALAIETLAGVPDERSELLLRTKIVREPLMEPDDPSAEARDPETSVEMSAFEALMRIAPDASFDFVAGYLCNNDANRMRGAALALGTSRMPEAFIALRERWSRIGERGVREVLALPIALLRSDEAFAFLIDELANAPLSLAEALVEALALYRDTAARTAEVKKIVEHRQSRALAQAFRKHFEPGPADN